MLQKRGGRAADAVERAETLVASAPDDALTLLEGAVSPRLRREDPALAGRASYLRAQLLAARGEYDQAISAIRASRHDWLAAGMVLEALRTDLGRGTVLNELGDYAQAIKVTQSLLEELDRWKQVDVDGKVLSSIRARAHANLGNAHNRLGAHEQAIRAYDVSSNLFYALGERDKQAEMDANRGIALLRRGMTHRALQELNRAYAALVDLDLPLAAGKCRIDMAEAELNLGRVSVALRILEETRPRLEELNAVPEVARLRLTLARALLFVGLAADARQEADRAADAFTELNMVAESAQAIGITGWASVELGEHRRAEQELAVAERLFADCGDRGSQAYLWLAQAGLLAVLGRVGAGVGLANTALNTLVDLGQGIHEAEARLLLAELEEDLETADNHLAIATELVDTLDVQWLRLRRNVVAGLLHRRAGRHGEAIAVLRAGLRAHFAQVLAGEVEPYADPGGWRNRAVSALIRALIERGDTDSVVEAWQTSTMAKSASLDAAVRRRARGVVRERGRHAEELRALSQLYDEVRTVTEDEQADLRELVLAGQQALTRAEFVALASSPTLGLDLRFPSVPEVAVLHYHLLGPDVVAFVVRDGGATARVLAGARGASAELAREWRAECERMRVAGDSVVGAELRAHGCADVMTGLYDVLVAPVDDLLAGLDGEPLVVVPDRQLHAVPFEALLHDGTTLADRFDLHFCHALPSGSAIEAPPVPERGGVVVLAVPDPTAPEITREAGIIGRLVPDAEVYVGEEATVDLLAERGAGVDVVHLACHGEWRPDGPMFSGVRLGDRWLTATEVLELDLRGALVVLSCCDVGRCDEDTSEPFGMVWAAFAAGASAVIASRWPVDDVVGTDFMRALYTYLTSGLTASEAVGLAQRHIRSRHNHPYFWAAFRYVSAPAIALVEAAPR